MKTSDKFLKEKFEFDLRILLEDKWLALTSLIKEKKVLISFLWLNLKILMHILQLMKRVLEKYFFL